MKKYFFIFFSVLCFILFFFSCKKDSEIVVDNNDSPYYGGIPKVILQNYINRLFIDLIGREALDAEMIAEENTFRENNISISSREKLITKLQTDTAYVFGDSSYKHAYFNRFYELCKARVLEAASNEYIMGEAGIANYGAISDSLAGDSLHYSISKKNVRNYILVIEAERAYRLDSIEIKDVFARMLNNGVYDQINMNTFNFLNSTFNDLFFRFPTTNEFNAGYPMIEYNTAEILFGKSAQDKGGYLSILVNSDEFYEGIIYWMYKNLLAREPSTQEVVDMMKSFFNDHDVKKVQLHIMRSDEYANFK